jgi:hypothetical protein
VARITRSVPDVMRTSTSKAAAAQCVTTVSSKTMGPSTGMDRTTMESMTAAMKSAVAAATSMARAIPSGRS